jgi:predicted MFS family arabinose efflux permease
MPEDRAEVGAKIPYHIALGSSAGGLLFDHSGYQSAFFASAAVLLLAALLTFLTSRSQVAQAA